jgi:hypothetical protein
MIWLTWRQHRAEALAIAAVLAALTAVALATGIGMHDAYKADGIAACRQAAAQGHPSERCLKAIETFEAGLPTVVTMIGPWLNLLPVLAGILIGVPLLAREYEHGTWQLAWTQGVSRTRWLTSKVALVVGVVIAAAAAYSALVSWWFEPVGPHAFTSDRFNNSLVFPAYVLLAVAMGVLAGALLKRNIAAMALTLPAFLAVRIFTEVRLRPSYQTPLTVRDEAWTVEQKGWVVYEFTEAPASSHSGEGFVAPENNIIDYHPADRFWDFQLMETTIVAALAVVMLALAFWLVSRVRR